MKLSKVMHVASVIAGLVGVGTFATAVLGGGAAAVFGVTKADALLCSAILILIAIWFVLGAMHHMVLEKSGERI